MKAILLLLFGGLKFGKLLTTGATMGISLFTYALLWGWRYAAGFIGLLLIHEMGHFIAARQRGLDVGAPTFIPFVGAWVELRDKPMNVETEAYIALAGPFVGTIASFGVYFWAREADSMLLLAIAYGGCFLNLFNLIPLSPLDGGRVTAVLGPRIWFLGVPLMLAVFLYQPSPFLVLVVILAAPALWQAWKFDPKAPENIAYYAMPTEARLEYMLMYLALVAVLAAMTFAVHDMLAPARHPTRL